MTAGCGSSGPERAVVSGEVTYNGQPVEKGTIRFLPTKGTETPPWGAHIVDGKYKAYGKGGVPVGTHKVEILGYRTRPGQVPTGEPPPGMTAEEAAREQFLPPKYNTQTELEITIEPGSGSVITDFRLAE